MSTDNSYVSELRDEIDTLGDQLSACESKLEEVTDDRDEWKQKYADLKQMVNDLEYFARFQ